MLTKDAFIKSIVTEGGEANVLANKMLTLLKDVNSEYKSKNLYDILSNRELFTLAKNEIYDILLDDDQKILDRVDKILWKEEHKEEKTKEHMEMYKHIFEFIDVKGGIQSVRDILEGGNMNIDGVLMWDIIVKEIKKKVDWFQDRNIEEEFSIENLGRMSLYEKSQLVIKWAKFYTSAFWILLLPEGYKDSKGEVFEDRASRNMNTIAVYMGIPLLDKESLLWRFSEKSMSMMVRLPWEFFSIFLYHFNITTPEQLNEIADRLVKYLPQMKHNGAILEAHMDGSVPEYDEHNYLVEFILDSFWNAESFAYFLEQYWVKTFEDLEKLFPYGVIGNISYQWYRTLWVEKANRYQEFFWITNIDKLVDFFELLLKGKDWIANSFDANNRYLDILKDIDIEELWFDEVEDIKKVQNSTISESDMRYQILKDGLKILSWSSSPSALEEFSEEIFLDENNWIQALINYSASFSEDIFFSDEYAKKVFEDLDAQNMVYDKIYTIYRKIIENKNLVFKEIPLLKALDFYQVGNLSYLKSLLSIIATLRNTKKQKVKKIHKIEDIEQFSNIKDNLCTLEIVMKHWSLTDKTNLYGNIASIMDINSGIAERCITIMLSLSRKNTKKFANEILPLIVSRIYMLDSVKDPWSFSASSSDFSAVEDFIIMIQENIQNQAENNSQNDLRWMVLKAMGESIKTRFKIKDISLEVMFEKMDMIQNYLVYLANIVHKDDKKMALLWLYLGLQLNDKWNDFRAGRDIPYEEIFESDMLQTLQEYFSKRWEYDMFSEYSDRQKALFQEDTIVTLWWNTLAEENQFATLKEYTKDLLDPDNFSQDENAMLKVLQEEKKLVGWVLAMMYQGKEDNFSREHYRVMGNLESLFWNITDKDRILSLQMLVNTVSPILSFVNFINSLDQYSRDDIIPSYNTLSQKIVSWENESLKGIVRNMRTVLDDQDGGKLITKLTSDFNIIIPNIRWCLWCLDKCCNNDTNLTFWDSNRFLATVYSENKKGSVADGIVNIFSYTLWEETEEGEVLKKNKTFVIERIYGKRDVDVLTGIIESILKKQQQSSIEDIDIFVSDQALTSCGVTDECINDYLQKQYRDMSVQRYDTITIDILPSASGKWYYEFAKDEEWRIAWTVNASGLLLKSFKKI